MKQFPETRRKRCCTAEQGASICELPRGHSRLLRC